MEIAIPNPNFLIFNPLPKSPIFKNSTPGLPFPHAAASPLSGRQKFNPRQTLASAAARRRVVHDEEEEFGYNEEIAVLETYSQIMKNEILLVRAEVDDEEVEVVIFKGFSSCLSYETSSDLCRSVIPARAAIISVDRVKGPFDPSNVEYIESGLSFDEIKRRVYTKKNTSN